MCFVLGHRAHNIFNQLYLLTNYSDILYPYLCQWQLLDKDLPLLVCVCVCVCVCVYLVVIILTLAFYDRIHRLVAYKQWKFIFIIWRLGNPRAQCGRFRAWWGSAFRFLGGHLLTVSSRVGRNKRAFWGLLFKGRRSYSRGLCLPLPKVLFPNTSTLEVRVSVYESEVGGHKHSVHNSDLYICNSFYFIFI